MKKEREKHDRESMLFESELVRIDAVDIDVVSTNNGKWHHLIRMLNPVRIYLDIILHDSK